MLLDDISTILKAGGTTGDGTEISLGFMPEKPDNCIAIYETGGMGPIRAMRTSPGQPVAEQPRIQVVVRGAAYDYATPRTKINALYKLLEGYGDTTVNGCRYLWIGAVQSPFPMQRDQAQGRPSMAVNFDVMKELT